jgi:hypothetical protein
MATPNPWKLPDWEERCPVCNIPILAGQSIPHPHVVGQLPYKRPEDAAEVSRPVWEWTCHGCGVVFRKPSPQG